MAKCRVKLHNPSWTFDLVQGTLIKIPQTEKWTFDPPWCVSKGDQIYISLKLAVAAFSKVN